MISVASMARRQELCSPFIPQCKSLRKTSAEIVSEARQALRVQSTQRPFTPADGHRQLFGGGSVRAGSDNRPPSAFSLHAKNFDAPDSRPGSGTRLPPLDHKPKSSALSVTEDPLKAFPKPPADPPGVKRGLVRARACLLRAGSLPTLPPVVRQTDERLNPDPNEKQPSTTGLDLLDNTEVCSGLLKPVLCRTASESRIMQPCVDSAVRSTERRPGLQTGSPDYPMEHVCDLCDRLHGTLAEANMLGRHCKRRSEILRALFRLIDLNSAQLNLHIAKLCLALCISGKNLLNICKLIFQISRSGSNDILFQNNSMIDDLLRLLITEDVLTSGEALLYCVATLKFLSGNSKILRLLLDKNYIGVAKNLVQKLNYSAGDTHFTIAGHILVQLTATLRNLADHPASRPLFVSHALLSELIVVLQYHRGDQDVCTNISRLYSKLSSYSECRLALAHTPSCYQLFLELLSKHHQKQDLVVRLLFTLGNLTAKGEDARQQLFRSKGCMDTLLKLYENYQQRSDPRKNPSSPQKSVQEDEDVLVKLVRVLANMCVHPAVGPALANDLRCVQLLVETLELRSVQESEELLLNVAATFNNLSFYQEGSSVLAHSRLSIAQLMLKLMLSSSTEAMLEATRVYGNLSQSKEVRDFMMQNKVYQFLVALLDSESNEMCFSACGVLTNLAKDPLNRVSLSQEGATAKLADCLRDFGTGDWQLAVQVCQAVWNMSGGGSEKLLDLQERELLLEILTSYLDKDGSLKWSEDKDVPDFHRACWESEFLPVAQELIKVLQTSDLTS
ncbi:armadillo repeat-containing protein 2 [Aulostomus maculatus]